MVPKRAAVCGAAGRRQLAAPPPRSRPRRPAPAALRARASARRASETVPRRPASRRARSGRTGPEPAVLGSGCWVLGSGSGFAGFRVPGSRSAFRVPSSDSTFPVPRSRSEFLVLESPDRERALVATGVSGRSGTTIQMATAVAAAVSGASQRNTRAGVHACAADAAGALRSIAASTAMQREQLDACSSTAAAALALSPPSAQAASVSASRQASDAVAGVCRSVVPSQLSGSRSLPIGSLFI